MAFRDLIATLSPLTQILDEATKAKVTAWLDEYKKAIAILEDFGFTVGSFTVSMGILPEVHTSITGSIQNIHEEALRKVMEEHQAESLLVSMVKALILLRHFWEHVELKLNSVTINVTLGVPPKIAVEAH
jgi:hypothetical protein